MNVAEEYVPAVTPVVTKLKVGDPADALPLATAIWPDVPSSETWEKFDPLMVTRPVPLRAATLESTVPSEMTGFPATPSPLAILSPLPTPKVRPVSVLELVLT